MARAVKRARGRSVVGLLLVAFLLVSAGVIWRRTFGIAQAREIRQLEQRRAQLAALEAKVQNEVREASSRARLAPIAEQRLRMRVPADTQVVILPRPLLPADVPR
jgi:cell division protein FtsL